MVSQKTRVEWNGQKENLNSKEVSVEGSVDPIGISGKGITILNCLQLGEKGQVLTLLHQPVTDTSFHRKEAMSLVMWPSSSFLILTREYVYLFEREREREREREKERERKRCGRETLIRCLPHAPQLGIKTATLKCALTRD